MSSVTNPTLEELEREEARLRAELEADAARRNEPNLKLAEVQRRLRLARIEKAISERSHQDILNIHRSLSTLPEGEREEVGRMLAEAEQAFDREAAAALKRREDVRARALERLKNVDEDHRRFVEADEEWLTFCRKRAAASGYPTDEATIRTTHDRVELRFPEGVGRAAALWLGHWLNFHGVAWRPSKE